MAMLLKNFNRHFTVRKLQQFGAPKSASLTDLELPRGSILHHLPSELVTEIGPTQALPYLANAEKLVMVNHVTEMTQHGIIGRPKRHNTNINKDVLQYHRVNKKLRRLRSDKLIETDSRTLLVENYSPLKRLYRYQQTIMSWYERWYNIYATMVDQLTIDCQKYDRQNYISIEVPETLPSIASLRRAEARRDNMTLDNMRNDNALMFLELWTWLGVKRSNGALSQLTEDQLKKINFLVIYRDRFINLNLGELDFWRKSASSKGRVEPAQMQLRLYKSFIDLVTKAVDTPQADINLDNLTDDIEFVLGANEQQSPDDAPEDIDNEIQTFEVEVKEVIDEQEDFEIVKKEESQSEITDIEVPVTLESGVLRECDRFIEGGQLTTKQYQIIQERAQLYKDIENPFGKGTLKDMLVVKPDEVKVDEEVLVDDATILDPELAKSTVTNFDKKYIENVLPKDVIGAVTAPQKAGVLMTDYRVEDIVDASGSAQLHTVKLEPIGGKSSTIRFTLPKLDERGYWTANDIQYTMRKQRVDIPIRKTAPDTVTITSFYGKNFIKRSSKAVNNAPKWLTDQIVAKGINTDDLDITNIKFSNVFDPTVELPRDYTTISTRLSGFNSGNTVYHFDYGNIELNFGADTVSELKTEGLVPIGISRTAVYAMDKFSTVYKKTASGLAEMGQIEDVLNIDTTKKPKEFSELSMMGKSISLALIFGYYLGIEAALKLFKVGYRIAEPGERVNKDEADMVIAMTDAKLVLTFDNQEQRMLFYGFNPYLKIMRNFSLRDFNSSDVYLNLLEKDGLTVRYLNELDLMDSMYIDTITERLLRKMGEPITFKGLLRRANEMLTTDSHPHETAADHMHLYGTQRIAGAVHTQMVRAIRDYRNKPGVNKKIDIPSNEIWSAIAQDPAVMPASDANPMQSIKEADVVTFGGTGGRSRRSMVKHTRKYTQEDLGLVSEATVDSGDVAITSYLTNNPIFDDVDGMMSNVDKSKIPTSRLISSYAALAPGALYDDDKRVNFIGIQHGSGIAADGYEVPAFRTGYEKVIAHRTKGSQANAAEFDGKVIEIDDTGITVQYNTDPKTEKTYRIGKTFGRHEGSVFPHHLVSGMKKGDKFKKGDIVTYNKKFFEPDVVNPKQVNWKAGVMANTVLLEGTDTLEDSSAISERLSEKLRTQVTKVKHIRLGFDQAIHGLVKVGDKVDPETVLATIEDAITAQNDAFSGDSLATLKKLSAQTPKAKIRGRIDRIEVFYNGEKEDMSESVLAVCKSGDRLRKKESKTSPDTIAETGKVDSTLRIEGIPVELDSAIVRIYITADVPAIGGDKAVFASQLKSTFRRVMTGTNETESGEKLDAIFGRVSVDNRIVLSVYQIGTTNKLAELISKECRQIAAAGG